MAPRRTEHCQRWLGVGQELGRTRRAEQIEQKREGNTVMPSTPNGTPSQREGSAYTITPQALSYTSIRLFSTTAPLVPQVLSETSEQK
eukprot:scaffold38022_cov26-Tisochrysis_lutea.AAC.1